MLVTHTITRGPFTGQVIAPLPWRPSTEFKETLSWKTSVYTSRDGSEQRAKGRKVPRQGFHLPLLLRDPVEMVRAENLARSWRGRRYGIPLWLESSTVVSGASGATFVGFTTSNADYRADSLAIIMSSETDYEIVEIVSVASNGLTIESGLTKARVGAAVMPLRVGRAVSNPELSRGPAGDGEVSLDVEVDDNVTITALGAATVQYAGTDVLTTCPLTFSEFVGAQVFNGDGLVDFDTGTTDLFSTWHENKKISTLGWVLDLDQLWDFKRWLYRQAGRWKNFWLPTFRNDLHVAQTGTLTNSVQVTNAGTFLPYTKQYLAFLDKAGGWQFSWFSTFNVNSPTLNTVILGQAISQPVDTLDLAMYMELSRFDTDRVEISMLGPTAVQVSINVITDLTCS